MSPEDQRAWMDALRNLSKQEVESMKGGTWVTPSSTIPPVTSAKPVLEETVKSEKLAPHLNEATQSVYTGQVPYQILEEMYSK